SRASSRRSRRAPTSRRRSATSSSTRRRSRSVVARARSCAASSRAGSGCDEAPGASSRPPTEGAGPAAFDTVSELRAILADVVTRLFTERVTRELRQSAESGAWPDALWTAVEENGLTLPLVPEARGGAGGTWGDAYIIASAAGRH